MLSYRHSYHAGNFADVLKHSTQVAILEYLKRKDKPFCYHDTHSGSGLYIIMSPEMQKNGEYRSGIGKLFGKKTGNKLIDGYLKLVKTINPDGRLKYYPGSPHVTLSCRRRDDRLQLTELHSTDFSHLQKLMAPQKKVNVFQQDAWQGMSAMLPPLEKRGLVLIDPSYEIKEDYKALVTHVIASHKRYSAGIFAIWYPVLERRKTEAFMGQLARSGIRNMLRIEHCVLPDEEQGMTGSGMVVINPPYTLKADMSAALPVLDKYLTGGKGLMLVEQLVDE